MDTANINIEINRKTYNKVKAKAALLEISISTFIERLLENNTKDIKCDKYIENGK